LLRGQLDVRPAEMIDYDGYNGVAACHPNHKVVMRTPDQEANGRMPEADSPLRRDPEAQPEFSQRAGPKQPDQESHLSPR
jgi:hypothetical protein